MNKHLAGIICGIACMLPFLQAQPGCLNINAGNDTTINCGTNCVNLTASVVAPGQTGSYVVNSIPYAPPVPFNTGNQMFINIDDEWSTALTLPFTFCFYGNSYNQVVVGTNGLISFDMSYAGGYCPWSFSASVPSPQLPLNAVYGAYHDIDPSVCGQIRYSIQGSAPCRMAVFNFNQVCHFDCNNLMSTTQIILYETTNLIEVYVQNKPTCNNWNSGNAIIGIQNAFGTVGLCPPNRNTGPWSTNNEAWRFSPSGPSNHVINWYQGGNLIGTGTTITVCPLTNTTYEAELVYTTCNGSTVKDTDNVIVFVNTGAGVIIVPGDTTICPGQSVTFNTLVCDTGTFVWQPGGQTTPSITVSPGGTTTYIVAHTLNGVTAYDTVTVTVSNGPVITFTGNTNICPGASTIIQTNGGVNHVWQPGGLIGSSQTLSPGSTTTYTVTAQDQYGCSGTASVTITVHPLPTITITGPSDICYGSPVTLTASGAQTYTWQPGAMTGPTVTTSPASTTTYTVTGTDANGCTNSATHTVNVNPYPNVSFTFSPKEGCSPLCVQFTNNSSISSGSIVASTWYFISDSSILANPNYCFYNTSADVAYIIPSVKAVSDKGCVSFAISSDTIKVYPQPVANFNVSDLPPYRPKLPIAFTDESAGATSWTWTTNYESSIEQNPKFTFPEQGEYTVCLSVRNDYYCSDSICKTIEVRSDITIPNVFTPNGDGKNDLFVIDGLYGTGNMLMIYNRWGKLIYENADYQNEWNGSIQGKPASDGTYFYIFKSFDAKEYTGSFALFR